MSSYVLIDGFLSYIKSRILQEKLSWMAARRLMEPHLNHLSKELIIRNELGLHARPAGRIAKMAGKAKSRVWLEKDGEAADASSIIDLLSMGCVSGSKITIRVEDRLDVDILNSISDLIENGFGE